MHQGDKVHRTVRRLLFVTRATGAARDEKLGEHRTFLKASQWVYSRASTGRGAGRAGCRFARARVRAEWLCQQEQAPPDMMTGQSIRTCLRREVPTDHEAHSHTQRRQLRERVSYALSNRVSAGLQPGGRSGNTMIQSRRVHDRGKPSRAKLDERCRTPLAVQTFEAKTPTTGQFPATRKSGPHVARRNPRPCRRKGGQPSSGIMYLHAQSLEGEESSSEWGWGLPDHA